MKSSRHDAEILDQFTRQADPSRRLPRLPERSAPRSHGRLRRSRIRPTRCDVGLRSRHYLCFLWRGARHVTRYRLRPAMLGAARGRYQGRADLTNLTWQLAPRPISRSQDHFRLRHHALHRFIISLTRSRAARDEARPQSASTACPRLAMLSRVSTQPRRRSDHWEILRMRPRTPTPSPRDLNSIAGGRSGAWSRSPRLTTGMEPGPGRSFGWFFSEARRC